MKREIHSRLLGNNGRTRGRLYLDKEYSQLLECDRCFKTRSPNHRATPYQMNKQKMVAAVHLQRMILDALVLLVLTVNHSEEAIMKSINFQKALTEYHHQISRSSSPLQSKAASEVLGITDPNLAVTSDLAEFLLSIVANVLTIWGFAQQQDTNKETERNENKTKTETTELIGKWNSTLESFSAHMEDVKQSLMELNCRLDGSQAMKNKSPISRACQQFTQPPISASTKIIPLAKQTSILKKSYFMSTPQYWLGLTK
ncbi:hypothetical protein OUZ56_019286 [Daphnia magna]|nr:hypothetical protein OUZ56_019286 [Daphnia magna]